MTSPASLRALLGNSLDYAGLFPPANVALEPALRNQAAYLVGADAWMLGAFVLPVTQFTAASPFVSLFNPVRPLRVSVLGSRTETADAFRQQLGQIGAAMGQWEKKHGPLIRFEQVEMPLPPDADAALLRDAGAALTASRVRPFWETSVEQSAGAIELIAAHRLRQPGSNAGFKLRTGGVVAAAFPTCAELAEVLVLASKHAVPLKFTAGLHHPLRHFNAGVGAKMHGFLNVLSAGIFTREFGWDASQTASMLADDDREAFRFVDPGLTWRDWRISTDRLLIHRPFVTSFGSCSFDEPREDLRALKLL